MSARSELDQIRQRAENPRAKYHHGPCSAPVCGSRHCQTARDRNVLLAFALAVLDLAEWHETKADKARLYPGPGNESAQIMTKAATVHDDAARRLVTLAEQHLTNGDDR